MNYYNVAVNFPIIHSILTYKSQEVFQAGDLVEVPLGKRREKGCIVENTPQPDAGEKETFETKEVLGPLEHFFIEPSLLNLLKWMSRYYHYSLGKLIFDVLPRPLKRPRKLNFFQGENKPLSFTRSCLQEEIKKKISKQINEGYSSHLIHGVTGSGKTTIYLDLIKKIMGEGRSVLFLLPEINLTSQFLGIFKNHVDGPIYSYNSSIGNSDKFGLWKLLENDNGPKLILGARSSVFLPIRNLGLIIIDEEHDLSFKQDDRCSYHARNVALKRGQILKIPVVLGSATPSTDALKIFEKNKNNYYRIKTRVSNASLPEIQLIDIRGPENKNFNKGHWPLSLAAISEINKSLKKDEQVLIFLNRLGYAHYLQCRACGHQFFCENCSIPLKYFKSKMQMGCQHCQYRGPVPVGCPECDNLNLLQMGFGTEKVQEVVQEIFPDKVVRRFDRDELTVMKHIDLRLNEFHDGKIDILVGTQMLSKGHNFKRVNLVLILGTDGQLSYPDFRSQEKVFQQVSQVSGRAGRFGKDGKVLIQTFMPKAQIYAHIRENSVDEFYREELSLRHEYKYPPYSKMAIIYLTSRFANRAQEDSHQLAFFLKSIAHDHFKEVEIYGPQMCNIEKRAKQFSWMVLLKSRSVNNLHNLIHTMRSNFKPKSSTSLKLDIDPMTIL